MVRHTETPRLDPIAIATFRFVFVSELARRAQRTTTTTTRTTMATAGATTRLTRERATAMVANMLRVALYTVTYCRGATTGE